MDEPTPVPIHHAPKQSPRRNRPQAAAVDRLLAPEAPPAPAVVGAPPAEPPTRRGHMLDFAGVPSKIVVTTEGAVLVTPEGITLLPKSDVASRLPVGARIEKRSAECYRSTQLNAAVTRPDTTHRTAIDAIEAFIPHFHRRDD